MNRQTKRNRKIKNKTKKYYGGDSKEVLQKSRGIFDVVGDTLSSYAGKTSDYIKRKGLRLAGLQPIKNPEEITKEVDTTATKEIDTKINDISDAASGLVSGVQSIGSNVVNVFDKGSAAVVGNINDVLQSPQVGETVNEAAQETAEIGEKLLEDFNEKLNTPEMKEETKIALDTAADYTNIALDSMDEPIDKAIDQLGDAGTKATSGVVSGLIKVGTDAMCAVPYVGAVFELGKMINDGSRAVGDVVEATSDATGTISKVVEETSKNIDEGIDKLDEKKKEAQQIANRTNKSIQTFENPIGGFRKTKRRFFKHKGKSKRVRFST